MLLNKNCIYTKKKCYLKRMKIILKPNKSSLKLNKCLFTSDTNSFAFLNVENQVLHNMTFKIRKM